MAKSKKKSKAQSQPHPETDQPSRKAPVNNNVADLVTHREKQIDSKKLKLGAKARDSDQESLPEGWYEFQEEEEEKRGEGGQMDKESKDRLLQTINWMMVKNKLNSKTAFTVPILSTEDFSARSEGDFAWSKMTSILENGQKIYGVRVDSIMEVVNKMSEALARKDKKDPLIQQSSTSKSKGPNPQKQPKLPELLSTDLKNLLFTHLEPNTETLQIDLKSKLATRKDPLFEKTSRMFDHSNLSSLFMNCLEFQEGLFMQINAEENPKRRKRVEREDQEIDEEIGYNRAVLREIKNRVKSDELRFSHSMEKFRGKLIECGMKFYPQVLQSSQQADEYQKILDMIKKGQIKSAFEVGKQSTYESQQIYYEDEDEQISASPQKSPSPQEQRNYIHNNVLQIEDDNYEIGLAHQQEESEEEDQFQVVNRQRNIRDAIKIREQSELINKVHDTRRKNLSNSIKKIIASQRKPQKDEQKPDSSYESGQSPIKNQKQKQKKPKIEAQQQQKQKQKSFFDPTVPCLYKQIFKKERMRYNWDDLDPIVDKNLMLPALYSGFQMQVFRLFSQRMVELRPLPTKAELKKGKGKKGKKAKIDQQVRQQIIQNRRQVLILTHPPNPNPLTNPTTTSAAINNPSSDSEPSPQQPSIDPNQARKQSITAVKQNLHSILKEAKNIKFSQLQLEYERQFGAVHRATLFISMVHLVNQRFVRAGQLGKRDFVVELL